MTELKIYDVRANPGDAAFLADDGKTSILYDTGFAFTGFEVAKKVKNILSGRGLDYIFLTHSHYDHALGSVYVKHYFPEAKVVAGEYAVKIFAKPTAKAIMRDLDRKFALECGVEQYEDLIDELNVDISVSDGDIIRAGDMEFVVLNLPGHTKCSVGYYCPERKLLMSCETIGVYNGSDAVVPSYLVGYEMTLKSIERVQSLDVESIVIPHYGLSVGDRAKFYLKKAKESAVSNAEEIVAMIKEGKSDHEIKEWFREKFYHGYIKDIYPVDAMELNTDITIGLLKSEFGLEKKKI